MILGAIIIEFVGLGCIVACIILVIREIIILKRGGL